MALPLSNNFETGEADETTITTGNSGGGTAGNAFDDVLISGSSTLVYDDARAAHGTLSARMVQDASSGVYVGWTTSLSGPSEHWGRVYVYFTAAPAVNALWLINPQLASSTAALFRYNTTGKIDIFDSTLSASTSTTNTVPLNEWVRLEWRLLNNTSNGIVELKMFHGDDSSPMETITRTSQNTLTSIDQVVIGQTAALSTGLTFWLDDIEVNGTGYPGPATTTTPPTLRTVQSSLRWG